MFFDLAEVGLSIKYITLQGGGGLSKCDRGRGNKDHVTSHFQFFRNSLFHVLFHILSCI